MCTDVQHHIASVEGVEKQLPELRLVIAGGEAGEEAAVAKKAVDPDPVDIDPERRPTDHEEEAIGYVPGGAQRISQPVAAPCDRDSSEEIDHASTRFGRSSPRRNASTLSTTTRVIAARVSTVAL